MVVAILKNGIVTTKDKIERSKDVDITERTVTHISHCYGYGGIDIGLERIFGSHIVTIAACEIEAFAVQNGIAKSEGGLHHGSIPFHTNLKSFPFGKFRGLVDIYSAGFPCQPFSTAGARSADEDPRHLFPHIKRGLVEMHPEWVFLENVEGILSAELKGDGWSDPCGTPILFHVLRELERVGYVAEAGIFSAAEVGAPHQRKRLYILGRRKEGWNHNGLHEVADTYNNGYCGWPKLGVTDSSSEVGASGTGAVDLSKQDLEHSCSLNVAGRPPILRDLWPSRPNEQQQVWEPPRAIRFKQTGQQGASDEEGSGGKSESKCQMGGDVDGITSGMVLPKHSSLSGQELEEIRDWMGRNTSRIEELRLLGNGVVPQTAEKAFRTLYQRLTNMA